MDVLCGSKEVQKVNTSVWLEVQIVDVFVRANEEVLQRETPFGLHSRDHLCYSSASFLIGHVKRSKTYFCKTT